MRVAMHFKYTLNGFFIDLKQRASAFAMPFLP
jgi:hypothetical protein